MNRTQATTTAAVVLGLVNLTVAIDTAYRFFGKLGVTNPIERAVVCGVGEMTIVVLTLFAWTTRKTGYAYLAYAAVLVQAIPALEVSHGSTAMGIMRIVFGPVVLAVVLHILLGLEVHVSGIRREGILGAALHELRERVTAFLGIGRRGADSAAIARSRAADRAVNLADSVAAANPGTRKHNRRAARLAAAIDGARHGLNRAEADAAEAAIVSRVVRRKSVAGLATITARHNWTATLEVPAAEVPQVPAEVPAGAAEVPQRVELPAAEVPAPLAPAPAPEVPQVPDEPVQVPPLTLVHTEAPAMAGSSVDVSAQVKAGSAEVPAEVPTPGRGAATRAARDLIAAGTMDPGTIRDTLAARGIVPPSDRYIRRLVSEARNDRGTGAYL